MLENSNHPGTTFLSSSSLKIIAMLSMLIDHLGAFILLPWLNNTFGIPNRAVWVDIYHMSRNIGRLAFPIFCFLLVEGFVHTRNTGKYMSRLAVFALLSEIPFDLAKTHSPFNMASQNVFFTLLAGLIAIWALKDLDNLWWKLTVIALSFLSVIILSTDYSYQGVAVIMILYLTRESRPVQSLLGALSFIGSWFAMPAFILTYFYDGSRGKFNSRLFYLIYPVHLLLYAAFSYFILN